MSIRSYTAIGRRKKAIAKVTLQVGTGLIVVNKKPVEKYFNYNSEYLRALRGPLIALGLENHYNLYIKTKGGGIKGQNDAVKLGLARAICIISSEKREILKSQGYLTRDYRIKERKKYGLRKARKAPQFSKR